MIQNIKVAKELVKLAKELLCYNTVMDYAKQNGFHLISMVGQQITFNKRSGFFDSFVTFNLEKEEAIAFIDLNKKIDLKSHTFNKNSKFKEIQQVLYNDLSEEYRKNKKNFSRTYDMLADQIAGFIYDTFIKKDYSHGYELMNN